MIYQSKDNGRESPLFGIIIFLLIKIKMYLRDGEKIFVEETGTRVITWGKL